MKIWVTWWWTWWHVIPIKSLIQYINQTTKFKSKISEFIWFWEEKWLEYRVFDEIYKETNSIPITFKWIQSGKLRRSFERKDIIKNIKDVFTTFKWIAQAYKHVKHSKIDILFSKWWYVSLPIVISCWLQKIPIIIHESDIHAWLTSKISSHFSKYVLSWFPGVLKNCVTIGQIIHPDLANFSGPYSESNNSKTHILVNGWSSWAKSIYEFIYSIESRVPDSVHIHVITGFRNLDHWITASKQITIYWFCWAKEMQHLYTICDITITRWWVTSLFEQDLFWMKMLMLPLSITHDQELNCKYYEELEKWHITIIQKKWRQDILEKNIIEYMNYKKPAINKDEIQKKVIYWVDQVARYLTQEFNQQ